MTVTFSEKTKTEYLSVKDGEREIKYPVPFVRGTHEEAFKQIADNPNSRAAEDIELSYIVDGAFKAETPGWAKIRDGVILSNSLRNPKRLLYLPKRISSNPFSDFNGGVIVQRDIKGLGVSGQFDYDANGEWEEQDGIYVNKKDEMIFVPASMYKGGEHTSKSYSKDGLVRALTGGEESAEILVKAAIDNKRKPWLWALDVSELENPEIRVPALYVDGGGRLGVFGDSLGGGGRCCFAAGVLK